MALNPEISLGVRPPVLQPLQIQSPLERYGKVLTLRGMMEQQQLRGLQVQEAQQQLAAGERKAQEDERRRQAIAKFQARFAGGQKPTAQQIWEDLGPDGTKVVSEMYDAETKRIGVEQARAGRFHSRAQSILDQNTDFALRYNIEQALADGDIAPQHAEEFLKYGISDPRTKTALTSIRDQGMKATEQLEEQRRDAEEKRKVLLFQPEFAKKTAESLAEQLGVAAQTAPNNQADWTVWRADLSPELQKRIPAMFSPVAREQVRMLGVKPTAPPALMDPATEAQQLRLREAGAPRFPSPGMTTEAEAQTIRIAKATQPEKPPSEGQAKALNFYRRMRDSEKTFERIESSMGDTGLVGQMWYKYGPNVAQTSTNQVLRQAQRQFTEARLRKESGAAIAQDEYDKDAITYFPQPGDSAETLKRKKAARGVVLDALKEEAGPAYKGEAGESGGGPPKVGATFNGQRVIRVTRIE